MNKKEPFDQENYRTFLLLEEIDKGETVSQRELAGRLGVAVGLVNSYLKNFVAKGFVRVKAYPRNRYAYLLTPKGFTEKGRLAYQHISYFTGLYTTARKAYFEQFDLFKNRCVHHVVFVGVDEVAEIAYLSLQEVGTQLAGVVDDSACGKDFFGHQVEPLEKVLQLDVPLVLTSLKRAESLSRSLKEMGVGDDRIFSVSR